MKRVAPARQPPQRRSARAHTHTALTHLHPAFPLLSLDFLGLFSSPRLPSPQSSPPFPTLTFFRPAPSHPPSLLFSLPPPTLAPGGGGGVNLGTLDAAEHEARRRGQDAHPLHLASTQPAQGERGCSTCMSRRKSSRTARRGHALRSASAGAAALLACSALLLRLARVRVRSRGPNSMNEGRSGIPTFVLPAGSTLIGSGRS